MTLQGEGYKCSQAEAGIYKQIFCLSRITAVFLMYKEIYVHIFAIIKQPTLYTGICIM